MCKEKEHLNDILDRKTILLLAFLLLLYFFFHFACGLLCVHVQILLSICTRQ